MEGFLKLKRITLSIFYLVICGSIKTWNIAPITYNWLVSFVSWSNITIGAAAYVFSIPTISSRKRRSFWLQIIIIPIPCALTVSGASVVLSA
jgi:hypothetical protein